MPREKQTPYKSRLRRSGVRMEKYRKFLAKISPVRLLPGCAHFLRLACWPLEGWLPEGLAVAGLAFLGRFLIQRSLAGWLAPRRAA